jgi:hypothetical protein
MLIDRRIYQNAPESLEPSDCVRVVQTDQTAVCDHIDMGDRDQLSPAGGPSRESQYGRRRRLHGYTHP